MTTPTRKSRKVQSWPAWAVVYSGIAICVDQNQRAAVFTNEDAAENKLHEMGEYHSIKRVTITAEN